MIPFTLRHVFAEMEARRRASDVEWTIVRPGLLTNGPRHYHVGLWYDK